MTYPDNYKSTARKESNPEQPYFDSYTAPAAAASRAYAITNARHLYNMRYVECLETGEAAPKTTFNLISDISWGQIIRQSAVYQDQHSLLSAYASEEEKAFISMEHLRPGDVLQSPGNAHTISALGFYETANRAAAVTLSSEQKATGLFLINYGDIHDIKLDAVTSTGSDCVGALCGMNEGTLGNITVLNTGDKSAVTGRRFVGGIVVYQSPAADAALEKLENRARVSGVDAVGGIAGQLTANPGVTISVKACSNYGRIVGLKPEANPPADAPQKTEHLGGIAGWTMAMAASGGKPEGIVLVEGCTSSPQFLEREILKPDGTLRVALLGDYVGGAIGANIVSVKNNQNLFSAYQSYNILGDVAGREFVGGFIGYQCLTRKDAAAIVTALADGIRVPARDADEQTRKRAYTDNIALLQTINQKGDSTTAVFQLKGLSAELRSVAGDVYVVGYCDTQTNLHILTVTNFTPVIANMALEMDEEGTVANYSYAGGIAEINCGRIDSCTGSSFGTNATDDIGSIVGLNLAKDARTLRFGEQKPLGVYSCTFTATLTGHDRVGGIAGVNKGTISDPRLSGDSGMATVTGYGSMVGGVAGWNTDEGNIILLTPLGVRVSGAGSDVGIVGSVEASTATLSYCRNSGFVQTTVSGDAGGIVSLAGKGCSVSDCRDTGVVTASNGTSGGICAINYGSITACTVAGDTARLAMAGMENVGAVAGINAETGTLSVCSVRNVSISNFTTGRTGSSIGGLVGLNSGRITLGAITVRDVAVSTNTNACSVGGLVGVNAGTVQGQTQAIVGRAGSADALTASFASSAVTYGNLGGLAGKNMGTIQNCAAYAAITGDKGTSSTPDNGYGGLAGLNSGTISDCSFDGTVYANGSVSAVSPIGGAVGKNLRGGTVLRCVVGVSLNSSINCGTTTAAYGYLGGMVGWNQGSVLGCDNHRYSKAAAVSITGYAGHTGGVVGFNDETGTVSADESAADAIIPLTTGENWTVNAKWYSNDCGTGGIMGYSSSGNDVRYAGNYATVWNTSGAGSNNAAGGIIGRLENKVKHNFRISYCENYGAVWSSALSGGFIGRWKFLGGTIEYSKNYGAIGIRPAGITSAHSVNTAGFVATLYELTKDTRVALTACENHGDLYASGTTAGLTGQPSLSAGVALTLSDCINTGAIDGTGNNNAGMSILSNNLYARFYRCRNYGNAGAKIVQTRFAGICIGSRAKEITYCFDYSNASKICPIANYSPEKSGTTNYYVYKMDENPGDEPQAGRLTINSAATGFIGANGAAVTAGNGNPFSMAYDGDSATRCSIAYSGTPVLDRTKGNPITMTFTLAEAGEMSGFGINWCNNGTLNGKCRQYIYKLYYVTPGGTRVEVTSPDTYKDRATYNQTLTANGGVTGLYVENGYATWDDESTYYHAFAAAAVQAIELVVYEVRNLDKETDAKKYAPGAVWTTGSTNAYICIFDIYGTPSGKTSADFKADPTAFFLTPSAAVNPGETTLPSVGLPLYGKANAGVYTLWDKTSNILTNLALDPFGTGRGRNESGQTRTNLVFATDFSPYADKDSSIRYSIIDELEPQRLEAFYQQRYRSCPQITRVGAEDFGSAYVISWECGTQPYQYEVAYAVEGVVERDSLTPIATSDTSCRIDMQEEWTGKEMTAYVRCVYWDTDGTLVRGPWVASQASLLKRALPTPQVHLELVGTDETSYVAVLENADDYQEANGNALDATISYTVDSTTKTFLVSQGRSEKLKVNSSTNVTITVQALATTLSQEQQVLYTKSLARSVQSRIYQVSDLMTRDFCTTSFDGFCGSSTDSLYYSLRVKSATQDVETYFYTELLAPDPALNGAAVVMSYGESHVTGLGQEMTATLSGLNKELTSTAGKIIIRSYPWRTQAYQAYYGHEVTASVTAADLPLLTDPARGGAAVYSDEGGFASGYVAQSNGDGTYRILYNVMLDYAAAFEVQIDRKEYLVDPVVGSISSGGTIFPIKPRPLIAPRFDYDEITDANTFTWDDGRSDAAARYALTLIGLTDGGAQVELGALDTTAANYHDGVWSATFADDNWNYPNIRLQVERIGTVDEKGPTTWFPAVAQRDFNLKMRLPQISAPLTAFYEHGGQVEKNNIIYKVSWTGLAATYQSHLQQYEIRAVCHTSEGETREQLFYTGQSTASAALVLSGTEPKLYAAAPNATEAVINLNCFAAYGGADIELSVRAIATEETTTYRSGAKGVGLTIALPARLAVPNLANLRCEAPGVMSTGQFTATGIRLTMAQAYQQVGSYEMTLAVVARAPDGSETLLETLADADHPISMSGTLASATYTRTGLSTDYAGCYLKAALRSISDSNISSVWTYEQNETAQYQYFRLPSVRVDTPSATVDTETITYKLSDNEVDWEHRNQVAFHFDEIRYAGSYRMELVQALRVENPDEEEDYLASTIANVRLVKTGAGYQVYYSATDDPAYVTEQRIAETPGEGWQLPYCVTIGAGEDALEMHAGIKLDGTHVTLVLPDCDVEKSYPTRNVTIQAIAETGQTKYVDSGKFSWFRAAVNNEEVTQTAIIDTLPTAPVVTDLRIEASEAADTAFTLRATSSSRLSMVMMIGTDVYAISLPGFASSASVSTLYQFDSATWAKYSGRTATVWFVSTIDGAGLSPQTEAKTIKFPVLTG